MRRGMRWIGAVILLLTPWRPAAAAVDMNGPWLVQLQLGGSDFFQCPLDFVQTGGALSFTGSCFVLSSGSGTIDSASGAFVLTVTDTTFCPGAVITGAAAPDGRTFAADVDCFGLHLVGSRCGNGVLDDGEACDDGSRTDGDCCSAETVCDLGNPCAASSCDGAGACVPTPISGPCDDGNPCTAGDACSDGFCAGAIVPDETPCDDRSQCSQGDACFSGFCYPGEDVQCGGCRTCDDELGCVDGREFSCAWGGGGSIRIHDDVVDGRDRLGARVGVPGWTTPADFGEPRTSTSWDVCVFDDYGYGSLLSSMTVPAGGTCGGKPCWRPTTRGYRYRDGAGTRDGVKSLVLEAGRKRSISVRAAAGVPIDGLPATTPVLVQVKGSEGQCWEATMDETLINGPTELRARGARLVD